MHKNQFTDKHKDVIRRFVNSDEFMDIKDAFTSHTPERGMEGRDGDSDSKLFGKFLGTRYVFNELEAIAQNNTDTDKKKQTGKQSLGKDADLDS